MAEYAINRVCVPMGNYPGAVEDALEVIEQLTDPFAAVVASSWRAQPLSWQAQPGRPGEAAWPARLAPHKSSGAGALVPRPPSIPAVSVLLSPEFLRPGDLEKLRRAGVDYAGVPLNAATPALFDAEDGGSPLWERYWAVLEEAVAVFGPGKAVCHLITGLGETEREMARTMQRVSDLGGVTHLSARVADGRFRRMQLARFMLDNHLATFQEFRFNREKQLTGVHVSRDLLCSVIEDGEPFMNSGCPGRGPDGKVACRRPDGDDHPGGYEPGEDPFGYPSEPGEEEIRRIVRQLKDSW